MVRMDTKQLRPILLQAQQRLIDELDVDYTVRLEQVSEPRIPTLTVYNRGRAFLKAYPMKQGRWRVLDIEYTRLHCTTPYYQYVETEHLVGHLTERVKNHENVF